MYTQAPFLPSELTEPSPAEVPPPGHPNHGNWHFIYNSSDFLISGKPLKPYFSPHSTPSYHESQVLGATRQAVAYRTRNRHLIVSSLGQLGLAPVSTQPGDYILIIIGEGIRVITRPQDSNRI